MKFIKLLIVMFFSITWLNASSCNFLIKNCEEKLQSSHLNNKLTNIQKKCYMQTLEKIYKEKDSDNVDIHFNCSNKNEYLIIYNINVFENLEKLSKTHYKNIEFIKEHFDKFRCKDLSVVYNSNIIEKTNIYHKKELITQFEFSKKTCKD